jgi:hypothetical protein
MSPGRRAGVGFVVGIICVSGIATTAVAHGQITILADVMTTHKDFSSGIGGPVTHGPIDPGSLTLHGLRLGYTEHGKIHSVNLGRDL